MSVIPSAQPSLKLTVTVVAARVHPVVTSSSEAMGTDRVSVCPVSSDIVMVPGRLLNTRRLRSTLGPVANRNVRDVPTELAKKMLLVGSASKGPSHVHCPVPKSIPSNTPFSGGPGGTGLSKFTVLVWGEGGWDGGGSGP